MHAVVDELADDVGPLERSARQAGLAVVPRPHSVEQVRDQPRAGVEGGGRLRVVGVAVADRGDGTGIDRAPHEVEPGR